MMDAPASPLILTKIRVPAPRPRSVPRARLLAALTLEPGTALALICAPAGYGKSTLLTEWSQSLAQHAVAVA
jgi:LuxR family maltose regulon positive regulatory protein